MPHDIFGNDWEAFDEWSRLKQQHESEIHQKNHQNLNLRQRVRQAVNEAQERLHLNKQQSSELEKIFFEEYDLDW